MHHKNYNESLNAFLNFTVKYYKLFLFQSVNIYLERFRKLSVRIVNSSNFYYNSQHVHFY